MIIGKKLWSFAAGNISMLSSGEEPRFTSHDKIALLNSSTEDATVKIVIFYEDIEPITDYEVVVKSKRVRKIRFNDLIDPLPIPLNVPYAFVLESTVPIVVQFSRAITAQAELSGIIVTPYHFNHE